MEFKGKPNQKERTCIKHTFDVEPGLNYHCRLSGNVNSFTGLGLQVCPESDNVESVPACRSNAPVAILSFAFPIYGVITAIRSGYNRVAAISGALIGFVLAMSFSAMAEDGEKIGFGIGHTSLFEYDPFSITDIVLNMLIGGVSSLRGFLYLLLD